MPSPLNSISLDDWFRRFDAAARHLPAEDRAAQHEELRQHLDALAAANVALGQSAEVAQQNALTRLGDPSQIGRKIDREWQQSRTGFRADMRAIGFGLSLYVAVLLALNITVPLWFSEVYPPLLMILAYILAVLRNTAVGLTYPHQAVKAALYSHLLGSLLFPVWLIVLHPHSLDPAQRLSLWSVLSDTLLRLPWWTVGSVIVAYLASATRRGWYRPSLADFKVSLPKKKARA